MIVFLLCLLLSGCVATTPTGSITFHAHSIEYKVPEAGKVYYKDEVKEAYYDTQTPSLIRDLIMAMTLQGLNKK